MDEIGAALQGTTMIAMQSRSRRHGQLKPVLSTMWSGPGDGPEWPEQVQVLARREHRYLLVWLFKFCKSARGRDAVILRGTVSAKELYCDLLAAAALRVLRNPARIVISDVTIDLGSRALQEKIPRRFQRLILWATRRAVHALDSRRTRWCVISTDEMRSLPDIWGIDEQHVVFTPFCHTLHDRSLTHDVESGDYVFSGGNSLRDYQPLLDAVAGTGIRTVIATTWTPEALPEEVFVGPVSHEQFVTLLRGSLAVVLPLQISPRSTGQQTYLNAMALGKPVVVTEAPGVRDYVLDGVNGLVCDPTSEGLRKAILRLTAGQEPNLGDDLGSRAAGSVHEQYQPRHYRQRLLAVALKDLT